MSSLQNTPLVSFDLVHHVLLDIEGTVSDVRFVYDVLFPYAKTHMANFLRESWGEEETSRAAEQVAVDANLSSAPWLDKTSKDPVASLDEHLQGLMNSDSKATGLKALQGLVWKSGFEKGELTSVLFPDVLPSLEAWKKGGKSISIYSSGSVLAQKLFFAHTTQGNVGSILSQYFDTTTGKKQSVESYRKIADELADAPNHILFISDVAEELIAAQEAGMRTVASVRASNKPLAETYDGPAVTTFADIALT